MSDQITVTLDRERYEAVQFALDRMIRFRMAGAPQEAMLEASNDLGWAADSPQPERYTVEKARARLRETFATHEWPQDGTDLEYFLRAAFPDNPQPAPGGEDGDWPPFVYVKQRTDGTYGAAVHKPGPAEGEATRLYVPAPDSGEGER